MFVNDNFRVVFPSPWFFIATINIFSFFGGKYRRNLLTLPESVWIFYIWPLYVIIENTLFMMMQRFSALLNPQTTFVLYYGLVTVTIQFYHGLWLPIKYLLISREQSETLEIFSIILIKCMYGSRPYASKTYQKARKALSTLSALSCVFMAQESWRFNTVISTNSRAVF